MIAIYYIYYFVFELVLGQTIGKMITKTEVVSTLEKKLSIKNVLFRTFSRLIPIDVFSYLFLSNGIHDLLSKTKLIYKN